MKSILLFFYIISPCLLYSQGESTTTFPKISIHDSIALSKTFKEFIIALEDENKTTIENLSLTEIECIMCVDSPEYNEEGYFTSVDNFLGKVKNFSESQIDKAYKKRGFRVMCMAIENFKPRSLPDNYPNNLILYHVWINTYKENELAKGHEGVSHAFQFVKIGKEFKFMD